MLLFSLCTQVDLIPVYFVVSGCIWIVWTICSALLRCSDAERAIGFYVGSGDLKVSVAVFSLMADIVVAVRGR